MSVTTKRVRSSPEIASIETQSRKNSPEAVENRLIFAMSVGLFQRVDLLQVFSDGDVQRRFLDRFCRLFPKPGDSQFAAFQFMVLAPLHLECLERR